MAARAGARRAFGGPVAANAAFRATLARQRIQLDAARLTVLDAAHALDLHGAKQVRYDFIRAFSTYGCAGVASRNTSTRVYTC